jgi:hypothetical protein
VDELLLATAGIHEDDVDDAARRTLDFLVHGPPL